MNNICILSLCKPGSEKLLAAELADASAHISEQGTGWMVAKISSDSKIFDLCFSYATLINPQKFSAATVKALADLLIQWFCDSARSEKFATPWPVAFGASGDTPGLSRRSVTVCNAWRQGLSGIMARVAKLAEISYDLSGPVSQQRGCFVCCAGPDSLWASREALFYGQRRMRDDPAAPSRSYLKAEEAYTVMGFEPTSGETVVDLGAAPGGWSYGAAKRGAQVLAVDNGPLKGGALNHPLIRHIRTDGFTYIPPQPVDWLLCDMVDDPHRVNDLLLRWLQKKMCKKFVVNLKIGQADGSLLLRRCRDRDKGVASFCKSLTIRQLFHDREEITVMGELGK